MTARTQPSLSKDARIARLVNLLRNAWTGQADFSVATVPDTTTILKTARHVTDARAFIAWLDTQASVSKTRGMGTMGYCMGGPMVVRTASASDRIRGAATFHSGVLVAENPDSPPLVRTTISRDPPRRTTRPAVTKRDREGDVAGGTASGARPAGSPARA